MFPKPLDGVGPRRTEGLPLGAVRSEAESEAEVSVRGSLGRLCQRRDDQRMARIDRYDERSHAQAGHGRADQSGQGDGVVVELLGHPDLADTRGEGTASLIDDVVDGVDRRGAPMKNCSGGHVCDNPPGPRRYSLSLRSRQVRRLVPVGEAPQSLALIDHGETIEDPSGELVADRRIYVLNARSGTVSVVSVVFFDRFFDTFSVGQDLGVVADGHRGKSIYVTTHNAILVIDGGTDRIVGTIQLGHAPWLIAVSPDGSRIYASHPKEDLISVSSTPQPRFLRYLLLRCPQGLLR